MEVLDHTCYNGHMEIPTDCQCSKHMMNHTPSASLENKFFMSLWIVLKGSGTDIEADGGKIDVKPSVQIYTSRSADSC